MKKKKKWKIAILLLILLLLVVGIAAWMYLSAKVREKHPDVSVNSRERVVYDADEEIEQTFEKYQNSENTQRAENIEGYKASYVLLTSDNVYLRYGALVKCMYSALAIVNTYPDSREVYGELSAKINEGITKERMNYSLFYSQFHHLDDLGDFFNDLYLKLQKQPDGSDSYVKPGDIVDTGEVDNNGEPIVFVANFSGTENLLINLFKQELL